MRAILFLLLVVLVFFAVLFILKRINQFRQRQDIEEASEPTPSEQMVKCAYCGVHLPESDAIQNGEKHFCGDAHQQAYLKQNTPD